MAFFSSLQNDHLARSTVLLVFVHIDFSYPASQSSNFKTTVWKYIHFDSKNQLQGMAKPLVCQTFIKQKMSLLD